MSNYDDGPSKSVGQRPIKSLSSVRPSVRPSLNFLKVGPLVFSDIFHDSSWSSYLVADEARFLKKNFSSLNLGPMDLNQAQNEVFRHFLVFGSYVFLEIVYNYSLRKCLTSSRGKTREKKFLGPKFGPNEQKSGPKLVFLPLSKVWFIIFLVNCVGW